MRCSEGDPKRLQPGVQRAQVEPVRRAVFIALLIASIVLVPRLIGGSDNGPSAGSVDQRLVGTWQYRNLVDGTNFAWDISVATGGNFSSKIEVAEKGIYDDGSKGELTLLPDGGRRRSATWNPQGDISDQATGVEPFSFVQFALGSVGNKSRAYGPNGYSGGSWRLSSRGQDSEVWTRTVRAGPLTYDATLEFGAGKSYSLRIVAKDGGTATAEGQKMRFVSSTSGTTDRGYAFMDTENLVLRDGDTQTMWKKAQ